MVAVHGSGMSNMVFLPKDAAVIEIFPYGFERITYEILARKIGNFHNRFVLTFRNQLLEMAKSGSIENCFSS
jgi:capsular polysaccharide biosynthesis protein